MLHGHGAIDSRLVGIVAASAPRMAVTTCMPMIAIPTVAETMKNFMFVKFGTVEWIW